jgi:ribulose-bisphosphate carboxylase large chain
MVSLNSIGLVGLAHLRRHSQLPIHGHRNGWGMLTRHPMLGVEFGVMQQLWRLAGADHLHVNGLRNKFWEPDDSVIASAMACLTPLSPDRPMVAMPAFSSGQGAAQVPETYARLGHADVLYLCGGGIIGHPLGVAAGVESIRDAWQAAMSGVDLASYAADHPALRAALEPRA